MLALISSLALAGVLLGDEPTAPRQDTITVKIAIDFGIAQRAEIRRDATIPRGGTVVDATKAVVALEQDVLCCSPTDVWSIDGVGPDVRRSAYWSWKLDGKAGPDFPAHYVLEEGDSVEWSYGGRVTKRIPTHRVVSLLPAATDIMLAIGAEDDLVAISHLCPQPEGRDVPRVVTATVDSDALSMRDIDRAVRESSAKRESLYRLDEAAITSTQPTEILTQGVCPVCAVPTVQAEALANANGDAPECPKLVVLTPRTLADVAADIRKVGDAVDRQREAEIVAHDFERRIAKTKAAAKPGPRPRVAAIEWFDPLWASGEWIAEMVEAAGGDPVLATAQQSSQRVEWDALVRADPDVIVLAACSMTVARTQREVPALTSRPEWAELRAVKAGRVFVMNGDAHFSSPGPGLARGVELLGAILADPDHAKSSSPMEWVRTTRD